MPTVADPSAWGAIPAQAPASSAGESPSDWGAIPAESPADWGAQLVDTAKQDYIAQQQASQSQPLLSKAGDVISDIPTALSGLYGTAKTALQTAPQLFEPNQTGTNARQDLLNAGLLNASDMYNAAKIQGPRFLNMLTGNQETPAQLGNDYDQEQAYQGIRNNISNLGANPAISQQLSQQGGLGSVLSNVSSPGTATVDPTRQNALETVADPTMYIPGVGAEESLIKGGLSLLGRDALKQVPKAGLTATLTGKALSGVGAGLGKLAGLKDGLNSGLQAAAKLAGANPATAEFLGHHGTEAALGAASHMMGLGHSGLAAGVFGPSLLTKAANATMAAGKILQEGEGTVPFFERMAQTAASQGNPLAAKAYQLMDTSGAGDLLTGAAKTIKNSVKATAVTAPLQLPFAGNDPQAIANTVAGNLAMGAVGGAVHEFTPMTAKDFQTRQDMDQAAMQMKLGKTWDDALQARTQTYLDRMTQTHPNIDPTSDAAQVIAAQAARQDMGTMATMLRSNPSITPTFNAGEGNNHAVSPDGKTSTINIDPTTGDMVSRALGHELLHHIQSGGQRPDVLNKLLGDPETKTNGLLRSYDANGTPTDTPEFQTFKPNYFNALAATGKDVSFGGKQSEADKRAAEEFYAEAMGSVLGGHTKGGELNYAAIRRTGGKPGIIEKYLRPGASQMQPVQMGFMQRPDGTRMPFNPLEWINKNPAIKKPLFDYLKNKEYIGQMAEKGGPTFDNSFANEKHSIDFLKANPDQALKLGYGNDASIKWSPDGKSIIGVRSPKEEKAFVEQQAKELFDKLKGDPKYVREVTDAKGSKSYQIIHLDDKILGSLTHLNPYQKGTLIKLNQVVNHAPGTVQRTTYQPALSKGRYQARERTVRATVPYDIFISQPEGGNGGSNILTHVLDIDQMIKNRANVLQMMQKAGMAIDPKHADNNWFRESLAKMAQAHFEGRKSTDGTGLSDDDRDFINATMGVTPKDEGAPREGVNNLLDQIKEKAGVPNITSAVKSFRLDRINKMEPAPEYGNIPYQYPASKVNRRPEEEGALHRPEDAEHDYLKNDPIEIPAQGREQSRQSASRSYDTPNGKAPLGRAEELAGGQPKGDSREQSRFGENDAQGTPYGGAPQQRPRSGQEISTANMGRSSAEGSPSGEQVDRFTGTSPTSPEQWLDSYVKHLGEQAATGKYTGDSKALFTHAGSSRSLITPKAVRKLKPFEGKGGEEHEVYAPPAEEGQNRKIYKVTKADGYLHDGGDELDYLRYLDKLDKLTGNKLNIEVLGVTPKDSTWPSIVTRMNYIEGRKPTAQELEEGLTKKYGFEPSDEYTKSFFAYKHPDTGLVIRDAHTGNFILTPEGDLVPIDVHTDGDVNKPMFRPDEIDNGASETHNAPHEQGEADRPSGQSIMAGQNSPVGVQPQVGEPDETGIHAERHAPSDEARASEAWAPRLVQLQKNRELLKEAGYDQYNNIGHWFPQGIYKMGEDDRPAHVYTNDIPEATIREHGYNGPISKLDALPKSIQETARQVVKEGRDYAENLVKPMVAVDKTGSGWLPHQLPLPHSKLQDYHTIWIKKNDLPERETSDDASSAHNGINFTRGKEDWTDDKDYLAHANLAIMKGPDGNDRVVVWEAQPSFRLWKTTATKKEAQEPVWKPAGVSRSEALERVAQEVKKFAQEHGNIPVVLGDANTVQHIYGRPGNSTKTFNVDYSSEGYATRAFKRVFEQGKPAPLKKVAFKDKLWMPALREEDRHAFSGYEFNP